MRIWAFILGLLGVFLASEAQAQTTCPPTAVILNSIPYGRGAGNSSFNCMVPAANSVVVTGAGNVPSFATNLPNGLTIPSPALSSNNTQIATTAFVKAANNTISISPSGDVTGATDSAAIAAAKTSAAASASRIFLTSGAWYINNSITIDRDNLYFDGAGTGYNASLICDASSTTINIVSGYNGPAFKVFLAASAVRNWGISNICIQTSSAGGTSQSGIYLDGAVYGNVNNVLIAVNGASQIGLLSNATSSTTTAVQFNIFTGVQVYLGPIASAVGVKLTGDTSGTNTSLNTLNNLTIFSNGIASHTLLWLAASDTNVFNNFNGYSFSPIALTAIKLDYSVVADWPVSTYFYGLEIGFNVTSGASAVTISGSPTAFATNHPNIMWGFATGNGAVLPNLSTLTATTGNITNISSATTVGYEWDIGSVNTFKIWPTGGISFGIPGDPGANAMFVKNYIQSGFNGTAQGNLIVAGLTSGAAIITTPAIAGTPTLTLGSNSGTPAVTASSPLAISAATGNITCATCLAGTAAALTKTDDTNVTLTLGGTPNTALLQATSLTLGWTGQLGLTRGGTAASLTASNGGIVYSGASALAVLSGTGTPSLPLLSGTSGAPSWATISYPSSATSGGIPYFSSTTAIASSALLAANQIMLGGGAGAPPTTFACATATTVVHGGAPPTCSQVSLTADVSGILPGANGGTGNGFFAVSGPATSLKTFAFPNASATVLTDNAVVTLAQGGTSAGLIASNGGIFYSTASAANILAGTATGGQILRSGASAAPAWSTATYPATAGTTANVLRSDGTNFLSAALAAADLSNGVSGSGAVVLVTSPTLVTPTLGTATATSLKTADIFPPSDSTTAFRVFKADNSTAVVTIDTTNSRVGIGPVGVPSYTLDVRGSANFQAVSGNTQVTFTDGSGTNTWAFLATTTPVGGIYDAITGVVAVSIAGTTDAVTINSTTDSTNATSGSLQAKGGFVATKRVWVPGLAAASAGLSAACIENTGEMTTNTGVTTCLISGREWKTNIRSLPDLSAALLKLEPRLFDWRNPKNGHPNQIGFIADEVGMVDERLGVKSKSDKWRSWNHEAVTTLLVQGYQHHDARIATLEADNDNLWKELEKLKLATGR